MKQLYHYLNTFKNLTCTQSCNNTVYVDAQWYRITCNNLHESEWELDKWIHKVTQRQYLTYSKSFILGGSGTAYEWNEQKQIYGTIKMR